MPVPACLGRVLVWSLGASLGSGSSLGPLGAVRDGFTSIDTNAARTIVAHLYNRVGYSLLPSTLLPTIPSPSHLPRAIRITPRRCKCETQTSEVVIEECKRHARRVSYTCIP